MQRIVVVVDQFEEARNLIRVGYVSHLRMALLLLDNASEVLMYRAVVDALRHNEWQSRLREQARRTMSKEKLAEFQEKFPFRAISAKERRVLLHDYAAKVDFLVSNMNKLPRAVGEVLKAIHRYRNEAYHRDKIRKETIRSAVIVLYDVATDLLPRLRGSVGPSWSSDDGWTSFCERYGLSGPFDMLGGGLDKVVARLKEDMHLNTRDLAEGLTSHLMERLADIDKAIAFVAENTVGGLTPQQELKRIQFWVEHGIVPQDAQDRRLQSYAARYSELDIERWRESSTALVQQTDKLELFSAFTRIEVELEELEEKVHEAARLVDQAIEAEVDRMRGK